MSDEPIRLSPKFKFFFVPSGQKESIFYCKNKKIKIGKLKMGPEAKEAI